MTLFIAYNIQLRKKTSESYLMRILSVENVLLSKKKDQAFEKVFTWSSNLFSENCRVNRNERIDDSKKVHVTILEQLYFICGQEVYAFTYMAYISKTEVCYKNVFSCTGNIVKTTNINDKG